MKGTLKTRILLASVILTLSAVLLSPTQSSFAATSGCINIAIAGNSGFVNETWPAAPTGKACIALHIQEPTEGRFNITTGWVFTEPLKVNGEVIPTHLVQGQSAPQIDPISFAVETDDVLTVEPTWSSNGTEVGLWWNYTKIITYTENMSFGTFQIKKNWTGVPGDTGQLVMNFPSAGIVSIDSGWTFDPKITLNGNPVETFVKQGEIALQIEPFKMNVSGEDVWTWTQSMANANAELGLSVSYTPKSYQIFLPLIAKPLEVLNAAAMLQENQQLQVRTMSWPQAVPGQVACFELSFVGTATNAILESGWFLGDMITSSTLNGSPIGIAITAPPSGETAIQLPSLSLDNPQSLKICIKGTNPGLEIGLRIRYPAP